MTPYEIARAKLLEQTNYEVMGKDCEISTLPINQTFVTWSHRIMRVEATLFDDKVMATTIKTPILTIPFKRNAIVTPVKYKRNYEK